MGNLTLTGNLPLLPNRPMASRLPHLRATHPPMGNLLLGAGAVAFSAGYPPAYGQPAAPSQSPYGQPPSYGQPANPYGPYGQPTQPSVPMYGQPGAPSQSPYGQPSAPSQGFPPAYGQPGAPTYGGGGAPSPFTTPPKKSPLGLILGIIGVVVLLAIVGVAALYAIGKGNNTAQNNGNPTATTGSAATATPNAQVLINDPLTTNNGQWANDSHCSIQPDGYHVKDNYECFAPVQTPTNFDMKVTVRQVSGSDTDPSGLLWGSDEQGTEYNLVVYSDGDWGMYKCDGKTQTCNPLVSPASNSAIHKGLNQKNTIEVRTTGSHFDFLINSTKVGQADDSSLTATHCGVFVGGTVEAAFTNFIITVPNS